MRLKSIHTKIKYCGVEEEIIDAEGMRRGNFTQLRKKTEKRTNKPAIRITNCCVTVVKCVTSLYSYLGMLF